MGNCHKSNRTVKTIEQIIFDIAETINKIRNPANKELDYSLLMKFAGRTNGHLSDVEQMDPSNYTYNELLALHDIVAVFRGVRIATVPPGTTQQELLEISKTRIRGKLALLNENASYLKRKNEEID